MTRWLLSGHNPRESLGVSYPITTSWFTEFASRQLEYVVGPLVGDAGELDLTIPTMVAVKGQSFINVSCLNRNIALVVPFDPGAFGIPQGLLPAEAKPRRATQLLLPWRMWRTYRRAMDAYRQAIPAYKATLLKVYWRMRECDSEGSGRLDEQDLDEIGQLFEARVLEQAVAYSNLIMFVGMLNTGIVGLVTGKAPSLLNLLVGSATATAQLGSRMWDLRTAALQCGENVLRMLREGETDVEKYRSLREAAPLLEAIEGFVRVYGHRSFHHASEFEATRLADQPEMVLLTIAGLLGESESPSARAAAARDVSVQALRRMNPLRRSLWKMVLEWGSALVEKREEIRDILELQGATYGYAARMLSRHYFPGQPPDTLWFYTFDEFLDFGQSRGQKRVSPEVIESRRGDLEAYRRTVLPELIWYDPQTREWWPVEEAQEERPALDDLRLQGIRGSIGRGPVEGRALVADDAEEAARRLLELDGPVVLVTYMTDPVWSSVFPRLTAVVTEMGGIISHAVSVARECGIPAVVGVPDAVRRIRDGQHVRVDGAAGIVEVIVDARSPAKRDGESERKAGIGGAQGGDGRRQP